MTRRKQPKPIGGPLDRLTADLAPATPLARIQAVWPNAVGDRISAACDPEDEQEGILTVSCESAVWAQQLTMMQSEILDKLEGLLPDRSCVPREIRFVVTDVNRGL